MVGKSVWRFNITLNIFGEEMWTKTETNMGYIKYIYTNTLIDMKNYYSKIWGKVLLRSKW